MSKITYQTIDSKQIYVNSSQANIFDNGTKKSEVVFNLNDVISNVEKNALEVRLSLVNAQIPYSFYQINSTNNKINIYYLGTWTSYYFPAGNYNVQTFITQWYSTIGSSYTITYSTVTNKFTFTNAYVFYFSDDVNSLFPVIGFQKGQLYISSGSLTSPYCYNFNGLTRLNIVSTNFSVKNIDSLNEGQSSIIASCPVNCNFGGIILYNNFTNFKSIINPSSLNTLGIEILDDYENFIDFNNVDWTLTFQVDIVKEIVFDTATFQEIYAREDLELLG